MSISMIGVDHSRAPLDIRALFAFSKKNAGEAMEKLKEQKGILGCIILSTCNRLEIWVSTEDDAEISLYDSLCRMKGVAEQGYEQYFVKREDREAAEHLFYLASGLKSQILGEDQILTRGGRDRDCATVSKRNGEYSGGMQADQLWGSYGISSTV